MGYIYLPALVGIVAQRMVRRVCPHCARKVTAPLVEQMAGATGLPILVLPNAGLPRLEHGETVFPGTADQMGEHAGRFIDLGASLVGSCCGSTPAFTGAIFDFVQGKTVRTDRTRPVGVHLAGPRRVTRIGEGGLVLIGERINPTGKPALAQNASTPPSPMPSRRQAATSSPSARSSPRTPRRGVSP